MASDTCKGACVLNGDGQFIDLRERTLVEFDYVDKEEGASHRLVEVDKVFIAKKTGAWTVTGFDFTRSAYRSFRMVKVQNLYEHA